MVPVDQRNSVVRFARVIGVYGSSDNGPVPVATAHHAGRRGDVQTTPLLMVTGEKPARIEQVSVCMRRRSLGGSVLTEMVHAQRQQPGDSRRG